MVLFFSFRFSLLLHDLRGQAPIVLGAGAARGVDCDRLLEWPGFREPNILANDTLKHVRAKPLTQLFYDLGRVPGPRVHTARENSEPQRPTPEHRASPTSVHITSSPSGAEIEIDGAFVGNTPSKVELDRGEHDVTISKSGFKKYNRKVRLSGGEITLNAELER